MQARRRNGETGKGEEAGTRWAFLAFYWQGLVPGHVHGLRMVRGAIIFKQHYSWSTEVLAPHDIKWPL